MPGIGRTREEALEILKYQYEYYNDGRKLMADPETNRWYARASDASCIKRACCWAPPDDRCNWAGAFAKLLCGCMWWITACWSVPKDAEARYYVFYRPTDDGRWRADIDFQWPPVLHEDECATTKVKEYVVLKEPDTIPAPTPGYEEFLE